MAKPCPPRFQKLQNQAARVLTFSDYDADADYFIERLGWQKLDIQHKYRTAVMVYKSINRLTPEYLSDLFTNRDSVTYHLLR